MQSRFDIPKIVEFFGGKHQIVLDFEKILDKKFSYKGVEKWVQRGRITTDRLLDLETIAEARKMKFRYKDYIIKDAV